MIGPRDVEIMGAVVPTLVPIFLTAGVAMLAFDRFFAMRGLYRRVWYPALFRLALFGCLFSGTGLIIY